MFSCINFNTQMSQKSPVFSSRLCICAFGCSFGLIIHLEELVTDTMLSNCCFGLEIFRFHNPRSITFCQYSVDCVRFSWFFFEHSENELYCWLGIDLEVISWFFSSHFDFSIHYRVNFALLQLHPLTRAMDFELPNKKLWPYSKYIKLLPEYGFAASTDHDWPFFYSLSLDSFLFLFSFFLF